MNYLKRSEFLRLIDIEGIMKQTITLPQIKEMLDKLESDILQHQYEVDINYIANARRKYLQLAINERLQSAGDLNFIIFDVLHSFYEFASDEYPGNPMSTCREIGMSVSEFDMYDQTYRIRGIRSEQEKVTLLDMIHKIRNFVITHLQ